MDIKKRVNKSFWFIYAAFALGFIVCFYNIIKIKFIEGDTWKDISTTIKNASRPRTIEPERGKILTLNLNGEPEVLAASMKMYRIYFNGEQLHIIEKDRKKKKKEFNRQDSINILAKQLSEYFKDKSASEYRQTIQNAYQKKRRTLLIGRQIDYIERKDISKFPLMNSAGGKYTDCMVSEGVNKRIHPYGQLALRAIGDVFLEKNIKDSKAAGRFGVELQFDSLLRGTSGLSNPLKVGMKKTIFDELNKPKNGADITLTLNMDMQDIVDGCLRRQAEKLGIERGCAVLMEVATGEIKAMANLYYSPNGYFEGGNIAIADLNPPGSTFKTVSMLVALEDGVITPDQIVDSYNKRYPKVTDHAPNKAWSAITASEVLIYSSNVGTSNIIGEAYESNPMKFVKAVKKTKIGEPFDIQLPGATTVHIGPMEYWKAGKDTINRTDLPTLSFGYQSAVPPIYMLRFYNAIANGGKMVNPFIIREINDNGKITKFSTKVVTQAIASPKSISEIQKMLSDVVAKKGGTGYAYRSDKVTFAGKTGTAFFRVGGKATDQVSFCGYFPAENPKYSCIVVMQRRGIWGTQSCEVFRDIAERIMALSTYRTPKTLQDSIIYYPQIKTSQKDELRNVLKKLDIDNNLPNDSWIVAKKDSSGIATTALQLIDGLVPNVVGMGAKDAIFLLEQRGMRVQIYGHGSVRRQSIAVGSRIVKGQTIVLELN